MAWLERQGDATSVVLLNRGPADAKQVTVTITSPDGAPLDLTLAGKWPLRLVMLAAGDVVFLPYVHVLGRCRW